jgi:hypothetical protein
MREAKSKAKALRVKQRENAIQNDRAARPRRSWSNVGLRTTEMPAASAAPPGSRIIESRGPFAVALAGAGAYLGLFRKELT